MTPVSILRKFYAMIDDARQREQTSTRRWIWVVMLIYLILFPFLLYASLFSFMIFERPVMKAFQLIIVALFLSIPLSIPVSIYFMWRRYFQKKYSEVRFYFVVPIITTAICYFMIESVGRLLFRGCQ